MKMIEQKTGGCIISITSIEALHVSSADVYFNKKDDIIVRGKEVKSKTLQDRKEYNRRLKELDRVDPSLYKGR